MPKSSPKNEEKPLVPEPTVDPVPTTETQAAQTAVDTDSEPSADPRDTAVPVAEDAPPVKVQLNPDFEALIESLNGDDPGIGDGVYVQVADLPANLDGVKDDRFLVPAEPTEVPAAVAKQLLDSPAVVEVAE